MHVQLESLIGMPKDTWKYNGQKLYTHECKKLNLKHKNIRKKFYQNIS